MPEHWEVTPVKFLAKVGNGSTPSREVPEYWADTGFPWLNSSVVNSQVVTEAEGFVISVARAWFYNLFQNWRHQQDNAPRHAGFVLLSVVDEEDHVVAERRLPNDLEKIA